MGSLFKTPEMPKVKPPAPMPDAQDAGAMDARRRKQAQLAARGGRESTILTEGGNPGVTTTYSNDKLGQ